VELESGEVVAYEALARGPAGSAVERPDRLFDIAAQQGRLAELDCACRAAAVRGALDAGLARPHKLFVNVEPRALGAACPAAHEVLWRRAGEELDVVLEITERALTTRLADLLHLVAEVRRRGWGIALDDVGADVRSLALMPLLRPDVIKLDLRLIQQQPSAEVAEIVNAVCAQRERTGALVVAEGVETEHHLTIAKAMGATLGQGWLFAHPAPLSVPAPAPARPVELLPAGAARPRPPRPTRSCAAAGRSAGPTSGSCSPSPSTSSSRPRAWARRRSSSPPSSPRSASPPRPTAATRSWAPTPPSWPRSAWAWPLSPRRASGAPRSTPPTPSGANGASSSSARTSRPPSWPWTWATRARRWSAGSTSR